MENCLNSDQKNASFHRYGAKYWNHESQRYEIYLTNDQEDLIEFSIQTKGIIWGTWEFQDQKEFEQIQTEVKRINKNESSNKSRFITQ
jgi:hypothetical protein